MATQVRTTPEMFCAELILSVMAEMTRMKTLTPLEPTAEVRLLLAHPHLQGRMVYLQGSIDLPTDLERCRADCAEAIFLFAVIVGSNGANKGRQFEAHFCERIFWER